MRKQIPYTMLAVLLNLLLSACAASVATSNVTPTPESVDSATDASETLFPPTITDAVGQEFTFDAPPKLACDWYGCYETLADLGVVLHAASMTPEMAGQPFYSPVGPPEHLIEDLSNPELWAATEMDVFLSRVPDDPYYDVFRQIAPVFFLHHPSYGVSSETGYQAYIANARLLGQLSGQPEAAEAAIAQFETMLANLRALSTPELAEQTVGVLWSGEGYSGLATNNPFCALLDDVGLGRCMGESTGRFVEYNAEEVLALNPDLIIYMLEGGPSHTERTDPVWSELTAVKEGRVFDVIGHRYTCCSMRGLIHSFQEYVSHVLPETGIPAPGPVETFDPSQSALVQSGETVAAPADTAIGVRTVTHDLGVTEAPLNPQRIVAINSASIELLATLGIKPVGVAPWIGAGNPVQVPPHLSVVMDLEGVTLVGDANQPNLEAIAAVQPDLILMSGGGFYQELYDQVSQIAPTVAFAAWPEGSPRSYWKEYFVNTATALGKAEEAQAVIDAWQARLANFKGAAALDETELSVIRLMPDSIMAYLKGSYSGTVLADAGVKQTESQEVVDFAKTISMEELPLIDGDILLLIQSDPNAAIYNQLIASPLWQQLGAVQADQVYLVNHDVWIGGDGYVSANLILDDLFRIFVAEE